MKGNGSLSFDEAKYKAFISYSHRDDGWAGWLHKALESYKPPNNLIGTVTEFGVVPNRVAPVFRDREELPSATDLGALLTQSLTDSACQIVVCSPAAARSKWVNEEILTFKRLGREHRIYALIIDGEPNASDMPGREDEECFPPALRFKLDADGNLGTQRTEPIAADARKNKDGKTNAKIKLIAGMMGVGFDQLAQRELHRRHQRMISVAVASITGMVITSVLAVSAILAREEAERQRERAEIEAETAQQTTNFMVELFEVSDPSEALGNSITAREILDRGARRIEFELTDQPQIQSTLMDTMGTVYRSLGLYPQARDLLERGLETRRQLFGTDHPQVARSQSNIAELLGVQAEFDEALQLYRDSIEILQNSPEASGAEVARAREGLAQVYSLQGDLAAAERELRQAVELQRQALGTNSLDLARSLDQLGMVVAFQGRPDEGEALLRESLEMRQVLIPGGVHPDLQQSLNNLAVFLYEQGRFDETERLFRESLQMNERLLGDDHPEFSVSLNNLAAVLNSQGEYDEAESYYQKALSLRLASFGPDHPQVAQTLNNLSFLFLNKNDIPTALEYSRRALETYRNAYSGDHPDIAYGMQNLANLQLEQNEFESAETLLDEALAMNQRILPEDHPDLGITYSGLASLYLKTERSEQALEMALLAYDIFIEGYGEEHWRTAWALSLQGEALVLQEHFEAAEPLVVDSFESLQANPGARPVHVREALQRVVNLYEGWGRSESLQPYAEYLNTEQ